MRNLLQGSTAVGISLAARSNTDTSSKRNKASKEEIYCENMQVKNHSKVAPLLGMHHQ